MKNLKHENTNVKLNKGLKNEDIDCEIDKSEISKIVDKQLTGVPFYSEAGQEYYNSMRAAANYAFANRSMISYLTRQVFKELYPNCGEMPLVYDVCHNIAKVETYSDSNYIVHRKGATRAFPSHHPQVPEKYKEIGQPVIIGGSMGTCSYVLVGTDEAIEKSFGSTCHGAGRKMSRMKAKREIKANNVINGMKEKGIEFRIVNPKAAAEECDEAYKDVSEVVETCEVAGISKKVIKLKSIITIKG